MNSKLISKNFRCHFAPPFTPVPPSKNSGYGPEVPLTYRNCFVEEFDNASLQALKDLEPSMNDLFTKTEEWQTFYEAELQVWGTVHHSVHQCILAEFQLYVGLLPSQQPVKATTTW